jgi:Nucleoside 2-deoxyribosyltransferase like
VTELVGQNWSDRIGQTELVRQNWLIRQLDLLAKLMSGCKLLNLRECDYLKTMATKSIEVKAPLRIKVTTPSVFLAGSIEMGKARLWQDEMIRMLSDMEVTVLNPRRNDWNKEWEQDPSFKPFKEQVDWEMDHLEMADVIALYFQPETISPISLLELGLHATSKKVIVCCPEGFWRRGNVHMVCMRYGIDVVETFEIFVERVKWRLQMCLNKRN